MLKSAWEEFARIGQPQPKEAFRYVKLREFYTKQPAIVTQEPRFDASEAVDVADHTHPFVRQRSKRALEEEQDPFALLGQTLTSPLFFYVPPGKQATIHLEAYQNVSLFAGRGAEVTVTVEGNLPDGWHNGVIDMVLDEMASATLYQCRRPSTESWVFDAVRATLKRGSRFKSVALMPGSATTRHDYRVALAGEGAEAALYGLWDLDEKRHAHVHVLVDHREPRCQSFQHFKGLLDGASRSSFEGKILVRQKGQQTNAYQMNPNLILSPTAQAYSKPNLEIFADDVKASHGATTGKLDEEQLFYLKTRGVPLAEARRLLIQGFAREILQHLPPSYADAALR